MALQDLVINQKQISEAILEKLLKERVDLIREQEGVHLTKIGHTFSNKTRILLFLCGKKAWEFLSSKKIWTSIREIEENLGIGGNTLRPLLKALKDSYRVESEKGKYRILPKGIFELEKELEREHEEKGSETEKIIKTAKRKGTKKSFSLGEFIKELYEEGFFKQPKKLSDIINELEKRGVITKSSSLPPYLLLLLHKRKLTREKITDGKRKLWVYKSPTKA